jgi:WD40 repeat protein
MLWDLAKHAPIDRPRRPQHAAGITAVAFSPDSRTLASGVREGTVFLTHVPDGTTLHILTVASTPRFPTAIAFSPDGNTLATAGSDGKVRLWDPHTGAARGPAWTAQGGSVLRVSFSPDGSLLATSGDDGTAALWDIGSGKQIGAPLTGPPGPTVAAFDPTGHTLATASQDGTVLLWDVDPASWRARACAVAGRRLTPQEWREFLPDRPYRPSC